MRITLDLNDLETLSAQCDEAVRELDDLNKRLKQAETEVPQRLADMGRDEAQLRFDDAASYYDGDNNSTTVSVENGRNKSTVVASGDNVTFLEFGAGVYYNGQDSYPGTRPPGIVGIGQYGKGYGNRNTWGYYAGEGDNKTLVRTHGNPASGAMYFAKLKVEDNAVKVIKDVIKA